MPEAARRRGARSSPRGGPGRPFVTTYHGAYGSVAPFKNFYNSVMARGDRVIANSRYTADLIAARHHVPPERIRVIYRGVDLAKFRPRRSSSRTGWRGSARRGASANGSRWCCRRRG